MPTDETAAPDARLAVFLATWNTHDLDRIVDLFVPDAAIEDDFVIIDPARPAGQRSYRGHDEIREFARIVTPGFRVDLLAATVEDDQIRFIAEVSADGLRSRGIDTIEQHDELLYAKKLVSRFTIGYPPVSRARLLRAASG